MILLPAIDILEGKAVRLTRGDFDQRTTYDADPLQAAQRWVDGGARALHVVDLDGARSGAAVESGARQADHRARVGAGPGRRRAADERGASRRVLKAGAARVVLGTAAFRDLDFLDEALVAHRDRVVVSIDARDGRLAASGWTEQTQIPVESVIDTLGRRGVTKFVYSSIERDGMMSGPDLDEVARVAAVVRGTFVYSGGVSTVDDLRALARLRQVNLTGVIVGKALYEQRFDVAAGQAALAG